MNRQDQINKINENPIWDIVIIGGGATGLGATLDAASRGLKVLCVEKTDFSKGTSSRSTKLIHGGVRYLEKGNIKLVRGALRERWFLLHNAPNVTKKIPFILPIYSYFSFFYYGLGLIIYDLLSGKLSIGKTRFLGKEKTLDAIPELNQTSLKGGILYYDGQFDDSGICIALAKTAIANDATVVNHVEVIGFNYTNKKIVSVNLKCGLTGIEMKAESKSFINATGVFADSLMYKDDKKHKAIVSPSQGIHIVLDKKFYTADHAMLIPKTSDGRVLFAVPWYDKVVIGTTDTSKPTPVEEPKADKAEIDFILGNYNQYSNQQVTKHDILAMYAGLRPLIKTQGISSTANLLRDHTILTSESGLITITGGKWTTYRKMAADVVRIAIKYAKLPYKPSRSKYIQLITESSLSSDYEVDLLDTKYHYTTHDVIKAVKEDMAMTLEDVLARRIRLLFLDVKTARVVAPKVAEIMAQLLNKDQGWQQKQINQFMRLSENYLP